MRPALTATLLALFLTVAAPASAGGDGIDLQISGIGRVPIDGSSMWVADAGVASWCSADDCRDSAALTVDPTAPSGGGGSIRTGGATSFALVLGEGGVATASVDGECEITFTERSSTALSGTVSCKDLPSSRGPLDVRGRFHASGLSQPVGQVPGIAAPPPGSGLAPQGAERIRDYAVDITVRPDGVLDVTEEIDYDFGDVAIDRHGIYRDIPNRFYYDETQDRIMPIEVVSVTATGGASADYEVEDLGDGQIRIKIGDADRTVEGRHTYTLRYTVEGALNAFEDHDELYWNAVGTNWSVPIAAAATTVRLPDDAVVQRATCFAGSAGSSTPCSGGPKTSGNQVRFGQDGLGPYQGLTTVVAVDPGAIAPQPEPILVERWAFERAFSVTPTTASASFALLTLLVGGFGLLVWRTGRDRRYAGGPVAATMGAEGMTEEAVPLLERGEMPVEFAPPDGIRPGQVGTLIDETANPLDVTATIVDLAVRGYLTIEEIPKEGWFGKPDWRITKAQDPPPLIEYERRLYDGLFAEAEGDSVLLSELKTKFADRLKSVQEALYRDAVRRKWFTTSPDKIRDRWRLWGWLVAIAGAGLTWLLAARTHWGLVGVAVVVGGVLFIFGARWMPRRTAAGTAMIRRVRGFRRFIESPTQSGIAQMAEREQMFTEYLPYAIVFGCTEQWAKAFADLGLEPAESSWFVANRPLRYSELGEVFDSFATVASGTVAATPASSGGSGFGGGGFSGGGGGGGGGGSW